MKVLIIGCGGIGSYLIGGISKYVENGQIGVENTFVIADSDVVEVKNLDYQNFTIDDVGENKARALMNRFGNEMLIEIVEQRVENPLFLKDFNLVICCTDNTSSRELVFKHAKDYIDLRAEGRYIMAFPMSNRQADLETLDLTDKTCGSCQKDSDREKGWIQNGNKIVAEIGLQMLLNYLRGVSNSSILMRI